MKINVGSKNKVKVTAVEETLKLYPNLFTTLSVEGVDVTVEEFGHPKNIREIFQGALDRAKKAFSDCNYSIGLESGLIQVPNCESGYMEICACVVFDGTKTFVGISTGFEWPIEVTKFILANRGGDASVAFKELGLTDSNKLGAEKGGIIGMLTNNRITREDQIKQSLIMALIRLEKPEYK